MPTLTGEKLIIAVDFDGTIVEHRFPQIGPPINDAFDILRKLQNEGHRLILWTFRSGKELDEAVHYCKANKLHFYAVNQNHPHEKYNNKISRKINADLFIDDRNLGGLPSWKEIYEIINCMISQLNY